MHTGAYHVKIVLSCAALHSHAATHSNTRKPTHPYLLPSQNPFSNMCYFPLFCSAVWAWWAVVMSPLEMKGAEAAVILPWHATTSPTAVIQSIPHPNIIMTEPTLSRRTPPPPKKKNIYIYIYCKKNYKTTKGTPQPCRALGRWEGNFQPATSKQKNNNKTSCLPPCQPAARTDLVPNVRRRCESCNRRLTLHTS